MMDREEWENLPDFLRYANVPKYEPKPVKEALDNLSSTLNKQKTSDALKKLTEFLRSLRNDDINKALGEFNAAAKEEQKAGTHSYEVVLEKFMFAIAEHPADVVHDAVMDKLTYHSADHKEKIAFLKRTIEKDIQNDKADYHSMLFSQGEKTKSNPQYKPDFEELLLIGCKSLNKETHEEAIRLIGDIYKKSPSDLLRVYGHIAENADEQGYLTGVTAIEKIVKCGLEFPEFSNQAVDTLANIISKEDAGENIGLYKDRAFVGICSIVLGQELKGPEFKIELTAHDFTKPENRKKSELLSDIVNGVLDNASEFPERMTNSAFALGMCLARKVPSYCTTYRQKAVDYITAPGSGRNQYDNAKSMEDFMKDTQQPLTHTFTMYQKILLMPDSFLIPPEGDTMTLYPRIKQIGEMNSKYRNDIKKILCIHTVKRSPEDYRDPNFALNELEEKYNFSLSIPADRKLFMTTAAEISREEYAGKILERFDELAGNSRPPHRLVSNAILNPAYKKFQETEDASVKAKSVSEINEKRKRVKSLLVIK